MQAANKTRCEIISEVKSCSERCARGTKKKTRHLKESKMTSYGYQLNYKIFARYLNLDLG